METALAVLTMLSLLTGTVVSARTALRLHGRQGPAVMVQPDMRAVQAP